MDDALINGNLPDPLKSSVNIVTFLEMLDRLEQTGCSRGGFVDLRYLSRPNHAPADPATLAHVSDRDAFAAMLPMGGPGCDADQDRIFGLVMPILIDGCAGELIHSYIASSDYRGMRAASIDSAVFE